MKRFQKQTISHRCGLAVALAVLCLVALTPWQSSVVGVPSLAITAPASGEVVSGAYTFEVDASQFPTVASVEYYVGSLRLGVSNTAPYSISWNTGYAGDGSMTVRAIAKDATGLLVATATQNFTTQNRGMTMAITSPDLGQPLGGLVSFSVSINDPIYYPSIFYLSIDGQRVGYADIASSTPTHSRTINIANVDTSNFSNGEHELAININEYRETSPPFSYVSSRGMINHLITINNGQTLMDVVPNYQHVYLRQGNNLQLNCTSVFTDNTKQACGSPLYTSSDTNVVAVSGTGLISALTNGFATITVTQGNKSSSVYVWVKANFNIPHFSGNGQLLNSYAPGSSIFPLAPFALDPLYLQGNPQLVSEVNQADINTLTTGFYINTRSTTQSFATWKSTQDSLITSRINFARDNGFHIFATGDDAMRRPGDDAWWTLNWPAGQQAAQYAMTTLANSGVAIALDVVDEGTMFWGPSPIVNAKVGQTNSFQSITCTGALCTVNWPNHGYTNQGQWLAFKGSSNTSLNTIAGQPFTAQNITQNSFQFAPLSSITGTFDATNDPNLEMLWFARWPCAGQPCNPFVVNDAVKRFSDWMHTSSARVPISWPALGHLPPIFHSNWVGQYAVDQGISDYASHYWASGPRTYSWSDSIQQQNASLRNSFYSRQPYMSSGRPQIMLTCASSFAYVKKTAGAAYYNPPTDVLDAPGCNAGGAQSGIMTAIALGNAAVRPYQFDVRTPEQRAAASVDSYFETGMSPFATEANSKQIWQAVAYAGNLVKLLTPYLLGTAGNSPGYGRNITSAVRTNEYGDKMLMIVNANDWARQIDVDLFPYSSLAVSGLVTEITRYRLSADGLMTDTVPASKGESLLLAAGETVVYVFPNQDVRKKRL
jgi:hypothetical protein